MRPLLLRSLLVLLLLAALPAAASHKGKEERPSPAPAEESRPPTETLSRTRGSVLIGGGRIDYTAHAGTLLLRGEEGAPKASAFYVAYLRDGVPEPEKRPLAFCFNGGPGAGSAWLHVGAFGPKRVRLDPAGGPQAPPYRLVNNEYSLLDVTDLVFVDPVSTGYSRPAPGEEKREFHGVEEDIRWAGEFIRLYTGRTNRWASPKFLVGESYGALRAVGLAARLQERFGLYLNGLVLVSPVLDFGTISFDPGNDLAHALILPTYTAAAWHHKRLGPELQADRARALRAAEEFATREYVPALLQGSALPEADRSAAVRRLSELTGLPARVFERANLRLPLRRFLKELLLDEERVLGIYDARVTGFDARPDQDRSEYDPSYENIQGAVEAAISSYLRSELAYPSDLHYEILASGRVHPWDYGVKNRYLNVADRLQETLSERPFLKVFVAAGYYDLATPYFSILHTVRHLGIAPALERNVRVAFYDSGHMLYTDEATLPRLKADLAAFFSWGVGE
ncbi:MAG: peptidase S10 [Deltaproteobacteria bacterium]|nr:peptidase S10 [Deltaproteobacteria bacterium]